MINTSNPLRKLLFRMPLPHDVRRKLIMTCSRSRRQAIHDARYQIDPASNTGLVDILRTRCLFIHIPKTAGISIAKTIYGNLGGNHAAIDDYLIAFSRQEFREMFKFCFVRNPFDRLQSAYHFLCHQGITPRDQSVGNMLKKKCDNFDDFVLNYLCESTRDQQIHFVPQYQFVTYPYTRQIAVDFVGHYESLEDDFGYVQQRLGIAGNLKSLNRTKKAKPITSFSQEAAKKIVFLYQQDFDLFGYSTDPPC